jgi:signal transduction histidine kinase/HAMP domain-containing protein
MSVKMKLIVGFAVILVMVITQSWLIVSMTHKRDRLSRQTMAMFQHNLTMKDRVIDLKSLETDLSNIIRNRQQVPEITHGDVRNHFSCVYIAQSLKQWHSAFTTSPGYSEMNDILKQMIMDMKPHLDQIESAILKIRALPPYMVQERSAILESEIDEPVMAMQKIAHDFVAQNSLFFALQNQSLQAYSTEMERNQFITIAAAMLLLLFTVFYVHYMLQPLNWLIRGVSRIRNGDLSCRVIKRGNDELGRLAEQFNAMTDEIKTHREHLEHLVNERTQELLGTQDALEKTNRDLTLTNQTLEIARFSMDMKTIELEKANLELTSTLQLLRSTQEDLIRREKMAALGDMVAGIAHEINTPVGVSLTAGSYLRGRIKEVLNSFQSGALTNAAFQDFLNNAIESITIISANLERAAELIISFKKVAVAQSSEEKENFSVSQYLNDIVRNLYPAIKRTGIEVQTDCDESLTLNSYPGSFTQIFTNLIMNSLTHAYGPEEKGTIHIRAVRDESCIVIEYSDDGSGIKKEILQRIFEPFFTTARGKGGSGLGLHIVYTIVTQILQSTISVSSEEGKGTRFTIRIPSEISDSRTS